MQKTLHSIAIVMLHIIRAAAESFFLFPSFSFAHWRSFFFFKSTLSPSPAGLLLFSSLPVLLTATGIGLKLTLLVKLEGEAVKGTYLLFSPAVY